MAKEFFKNLPDTTTPLEASRLNGLLDGEEPMGNIVVDSIRSKNMLDVIIGNQTKNGINFTVNKDKSITLSGTSTAQTDFYIQPINQTILKAGTYTLSTLGFTNDIYFLFGGSSSSVSYQEINSNTSFTFTLSSDGGFGYSIIRVPNNRTINVTIKLQLEEGDTATNYAPYQELDNIYDTGWVAMSSYINTTYFTARPNYAPYVRRIGKNVYWIGEVYCTTNVGGTATQLLNSIPEQFRPLYQYSTSGHKYNSSDNYNMYISSNGNISISQGSNITTTSEYNGYQLSNLTGYLVD